MRSVLAHSSSSLLRSSAPFGGSNWSAVGCGGSELRTGGRGVFTLIISNMFMTYDNVMMSCHVILWFLSKQTKANRQQNEIPVSCRFDIVFLRLFKLSIPSISDLSRICLQ